MDNINEALKALTEKPLKSTSFDRVRLLGEMRDNYKDLPQPERFGKIMYDFLDKVEIPLVRGDLIAGRASDKLLSDEEEEYFRQFEHDPNNLYRNTIFDTGHCTLDWENLINLGITGMKDRAIESLECHADEEQKSFLRGAIGLYDAIINFMARYANAAKEMGDQELCDSLTSLTIGAPKNFRDALQLCWIIALIDTSYIAPNPTLSVGRLDKYLYKFYRNDIDSGVYTKERLSEFIVDYYCKHNLNMGRGEHQLGDESNTTGFNRIFNFDAPQYLAIAGTDEQGKPVANELTQLMVDCIVPRFKNPVFVVRYYKGMADDYPELWSSICRKALQSSSLMIYNDNDVIGAFNRLGVPVEDARNYEHFGCNWAGLGQNSCWMHSAPHSSHFYPEMSETEREELKCHYMRTTSVCGWVGEFLGVIRELNSRAQAPDSIEEFYDEFFERFREFISCKLERIKSELEVRYRRPSRVISFGDCMRLNPIVTATANNTTAAKYHFEIHSFMSAATIADCFTAVDQLVFKEKKLTLKQLVSAMDANFEGYDDVLALCRNADKFGSDGELSNYHAKRLVDTYADILKELSAPYFEKYGIVLMPTIQTDTWNIKEGRVTGASPDGRLAGEPFSQNSRPALGSCRNGLTGMLSSLLHLPFDKLASGSLNLDVQPQQFKGEAGERVFENLLKTYFDNGGLHAQVSCLDVSELEDAKLHPEKHGDLLVRVTGYSGIFVDMGEKVQDYVIERMKK